MSETLIGKAFTNSFSFPGGFVVQADKPIDDRLVVHSVASLTAEDTFVSSTDNLLKAYNGMVVSVLETNDLYILTDVTNITSISSWEKINVPKFANADTGRLLTVVQVQTGTDKDTGLPIYKYEAQWADAPSGLPEMGETESGKLLSVVANQIGTDEETGKPIYEYVSQWIDVPTELPETIGETGQVLKVGSDSDGNKIVKWENEKQELPTSTAVNKGQALVIDANGRPKWDTIDTSLVENIQYPEFENLTTTGTLKPGMKYRIEYQMPLNPSKTFNTSHGTYTLGLEHPRAPFDIILTASSPTTFFEDVELITNNVGIELGYEKNHFSKYDAKMEILLNESENEYSYIDTNAPYVITYMKDDNGNEADYDFVNLRYVDTTAHIMYPTFSEQLKLGKMDIQHAIVRNLKIKSPSKYELPFVIYQFDTYAEPTMVQSVELINNVTILNSTNIFIKNVILSNSNILNSQDIKFDIETIALDAENNVIEQYCDSTIQIDNMTIVDNIGLTICERVITIPSISINTNTSFISNINFVPCHKARMMTYGQLLANMRTIIGDSISEMNDVDLNTNWLSQIINVDEALPCLSLLFSKTKPSAITTSVENDIFDLVSTSTKNITYSIFEFDKKQYTIEIPQFQSTATSVVELGI